MGDKVQRQESKEFQFKLDIDRLLRKGRRVPGQVDETLFSAVCQALGDVMAGFGDPRKTKLALNNNLWRREGIRFDTADRRLRTNYLTLAVEATAARTKLKCKKHHFIPEMLFEKPERSIPYPSRGAAQKYRKHDATLKLEQDLHLNNVKHCASGSLYVKGRQTRLDSLGVFSHYFPGLSAIAPPDTPLIEVSHWDEAIFDDMTVSSGSLEVDNWMLVNRWDAKSGALLESELSFKVAKAMDDPWDYRALGNATKLYLALQKSGIFQQQPPIFTFDNPVSSIDIVKAEAPTAARKRPS